MVYFASPVFFMLFPVLIFFVIFLILRKKNRRKNLIAFPQQILLNNVKKSRKLKIYPVINIINCLILTLFVVSLARPQIGNKTTDVLNQGLDIVLALDVSSSMEALDFEPINRMEAAKKVAIDFVKNRKYDRIGLICFSGMAFTQVPITNDINTLMKMISNITTRMISVDGTAIGSAIVTSCARLKDSKSKGKIIILITDGANNIGEVDPITAAEIAKDLGIRVYTIGAGSLDGGYYQTIDNNSIKKIKLKESELDEETLKKIADISNGQYFRAGDTKALNKIMKQIDKIEKTKIKDINFSSYTDLYDKFILCLLVLLLVNMFFEHVIFRKLI